MKGPKTRPYYIETMNHDARIAAAERAHALMIEARALLESAGILGLPGRPMKTSATYAPTVGSYVEASIEACADASAALERQRPVIRKGDPVHVLNRWGRPDQTTGEFVDVTRAAIRVRFGARVTRFSLEGFDPNDRIDDDDLARILRDHGPKR